MPKYELMYIIGSQVSDHEIPKLTEEVKSFIEKNAGIIEKHEDLGKKKLAYPIKKTRIGNYVLVNFSSPAEKINEIEHKIRTTQGIIRHLMLNMDEGLERQAKDRIVQAKLKISKPKETAPREKPAVKEKKIEIDLDKEIEKALESPEELK